MNPFITNVMINNFSVDYQVFRIGKKFKAMLVQTYLGKYLPCQLDFWKEDGEWKTYHEPLDKQVLQEFGDSIDNHLADVPEKDSKNSAMR